MKVVFATRSDFLTKKGGDTTQLLQTKMHLEKSFNYQIDIVTSVDELKKHTDASIIHVFNLQTRAQTLAYIVEAKKMNKKIVLSTIYWDLLHAGIIYTSFSKFGDIRYAQILSVLTRLCIPLIKMIPGDGYLRREYIKKCKEIIDSSDILLPNSNEELDVIENEFGYVNLKNKSHFVPNAVTLEQNKGGDENNRDRRGVLIVGRIEPNKNQLSLVRAIAKSKLINEPVYIIGRADDNEYFNKLKLEASNLPDIHIINELPYEKVIEFYKKCRIHVLPSFRESPGLVSLEAMYYGCNVVVSSGLFCPINYYEFDKYGFVCNPYSIRSIAKAMEAAYIDKVTLPIDHFVKFSFENAALETHNAYKNIIIDA
ncbi:glycosyltransferase family 4 protein [Aeromonas veronii]